MFYFCMTRDRRPASAVVAFAVFAAAGVGGVVAARVIRAVSETATRQPPAHTASATTDGGPTNFTTTVPSSTYSLQVDVDPARTGSNTIHLYARSPDNKPLPVVGWSGAAELPGKGLQPVAIPFLPLTADHATGLVSLPAAGDWQLRVTVRISTTDQATVTVVVPVRE
jgi:hypothetical protein